MTSDRHARIKELFLRICDLPDGERLAALDRVCGDDRELRRELESLLGFHGDTGSPSNRGPAGPPSFPQPEPLPEKIAGYRVLGKLGEGGMGVVYEVRQDRPVRRRLALKLVRCCMDTGEVLARFELERQALALMNHPNIAKVFDAGATEEGRPFFTMEYVDGEPVTSYCDRHRLSTPERLELFIPICHGVQHAHHNGIIHRDIKSSNVLVRLRDGKPVPTIIDFGVAKATQQRLTEKTLYTERGILIGTPEYMSPEQADPAGSEVDTRTDVYSLGVVLYELLVGALPFEPRTLRVAGFDEIRRRIREEEPSRPSTRVGTLGGKESAEAARRRRTDPRGLRRELRGDLDWITMKALEKDRTRRYASPAEMAADVARHLRDEPVLAGPPGAGYQIRKFVRRHRIGVGAGAAVVLALLLGLVLAATGLVRARRAERAALKEAERATKVSELLIDLFDDLNPGVPGHVDTPEDVLDRARQRIQAEMGEAPDLQARLLGTVGGALASLGMWDQGRALIEESLAISREHLPPDHPNLALSLNGVGYLAAASGDLERAQRLHEEALQIQKKFLRPDQVSLTLGRTYHSLGDIRFRQGDIAGARSYLDRAVEIHERGKWPNPVHLARALVSRAILHTDGDLDHRAAVPLLERALEILEGEFGPDSGEVGNVRFWLGQVRYRLGDLESARPYYQSALSLQQRTGGADGVGAARAITGLGEILTRQGDLAGARRHLERALSILDTQGVQGSDREWLVRCLAAVYRRTGDIDGARRLLEGSLEDLERGSGRDHPVLSRTLHELGYLEFREGRLDRARQWYRRALEIQAKHWGPGHYVNHWALYRLACIAALEGGKDRALDLLREAVDCGFDGGGILEEEALAGLHGDPGFETIVSEVRRRLAGDAAEVP